MNCKPALRWSISRRRFRFACSGYFYERLSTGIKDPLHARAIVFQQGKESAAFVFCDLVGIPFAVTAPARKKASEATGIPVEHIAVTGTHTHTGPQFFMSMQRLLARAGRRQAGQRSVRQRAVSSRVD